jgi:glutaredoxin
MSNNAEKIYSKINNNNDYIVFGLSTCVFCKRTIEFLQKNNIRYKYYIIDDFKELFFKNFVKLANIYNKLNINSEHKTVPIVFYKKKFIGGYTDLVNNFQTN